jgi:hypothetical protein
MMKALLRRRSAALVVPVLVTVLLVLGFLLPREGHAAAPAEQWQAIAAQLEVAGLPPEQVEVPPIIPDPRIPLPRDTILRLPRLPQPTVPPPAPLVACGTTLTDIKEMRLNVQGETEECVLVFEGTPGYRFSFRVRPISPEMRVEVALFEPDGDEMLRVVAESPSEPALVRFTIPPGGLVTLVITTSRPGMVALEQAAIPVLFSSATCGGALTAGDVLNHFILSFGKECWYTYDGRAGQTIIVSMSTSDTQLDPLLKLYSQSGDTLGSDDNGGGAKNAKLITQLLNDDRYTLVARDYAHNYGGAFRLEFEVSDTPPACGGQVPIGSTIAGELSEPDQECVFTMSGTRGQVVTLTAAKTGGSLDTVLEVYGPNYPAGARLAYNDDSAAAGGRNSQIGGLVLPATQQYTLVVTSFAGLSTGPFTLSIRTP